MNACVMNRAVSRLSVRKAENMLEIIQEAKSCIQFNQLYHLYLLASNKRGNNKYVIRSANK